MAARIAYGKRTKAKLKKLKDQQKEKEWWKENNLLLGAIAKICSILAPEDASNIGVLEASEKATLIAKTLQNKCTIRPGVVNEYSEIRQAGDAQD